MCWVTTPKFKACILQTQRVAVTCLFSHFFQLWSELGFSFGLDSALSSCVCAGLGIVGVWRPQVLMMSQSWPRQSWPHQNPKNIIISPRATFVMGFFTSLVGKPKSDFFYIVVLKTIKCFCPCVDNHQIPLQHWRKVKSWRGKLKKPLKCVCGFIHGEGFLGTISQQQICHPFRGRNVWCVSGGTETSRSGLCSPSKLIYSAEPQLTAAEEPFIFRPSSNQRHS